MHPLCLGKADRTTYQVLDSRPQPDVLALDLLRLVFTNPMLLSIEMPLVSVPLISVIARDIKGLLCVPKTRRC